MTKEAALDAFFNGFTIPAYPFTAVPDDGIYPYLTYTPVTGGFGDEVSITVQLWYRSESEAEPNAKARELFEAIGRGGTLIACDDGLIWLKRGSPWCQSLGETGDDKIKRRYINVEAEFLTES